MDKHAKLGLHQAASSTRPDRPVITGRLLPSTGKKLARDSSFNSLQLTGKGRADSKNNKAAIDSQRCNRRQTDE
ncbi:hypothetical protein VI06_01095 [Aquitalea magnusonii]|uniref:hypothetical protein n=1 Tax=Aquitalea sp. USM4 TaxID=1590041 RepID=UPI0005F814E6|nr:hypothetical protein [Aquitalea sp. USM4]KJV33886.1 hypothetical protein VI06_01095 [Aquitalea magnusonii]QBJ79899.1 hypothetical protein DKK66_18585 [Aquitalea sp. USM4]